MAQMTCQNLSVGYDNRAILKNLNFSINRGEYLCIVGENGAGKSTLMKTLLHLLPPVSGKILLGDGLTENEIGYLPQQTSSQKDFPATVWEVILSGCLSTRKGRFFYSKEDKEKARRQMRHLELENLASRSFGELSGGQQQRVLIARALCATESLLILDEPVTGLDPAVTRELYEILEKLNKKEHTAIVMVTHDIAGALPYADKVLHIGPQGYFFGTRREYCASEEGKRMLGTAFREEEEK